MFCRKSAIKKFVEKGGKKIVETSCLFAERGNTAKHQVKSFTLKV
jgi:hypothetical protein